MARILIVEDEEPIRELVKLNLKFAGYEVVEAKDGLAGALALEQEKLDLALLDIMLPGLDGYRLLPIAGAKQIPVIMLTAKDSLKDKVQGLNMGADDYITKPFEAMELLARIEAVLRRSKPKEKTTLVFDDIVLLRDKHKVLKDGAEIELTYKEFELLWFLVEHKGKVISRERLLEEVWDYENEVNTRTVDIHVQRLRTKLDTDKIKTVYKVGYRLEEE